MGCVGHVHAHSIPFPYVLVAEFQSIGMGMARHANFVLGGPHGWFNSQRNLRKYGKRIEKVIEAIFSVYPFQKSSHDNLKKQKLKTTPNN